MRELFLINFDGTQYGVWREDVISVKDLKNIHRLPLSPACFAGVSVLEGDTVALFDLGACIGFPPMSRKQSEHLLLMSKKKQSAGLAVEGDIEHIDVPADAVFPMPDYLKTQAVDTCVVHKGFAIPVINISFIYSKRRKGEWEPPVSEFTVSGKARAPKQSSDKSVKKIRIFRTSGETFAVSASCIKKVSTVPKLISPLTLTPPYVEGIVFHRDRVIPLISMSQRLKLPPNKAQKTMLCAYLNGTEFGFRVDSDEKTLTGKNFTIKPLPPLVQSGGMKSAVLQKGKITPLVNLPALMSRYQDEKPFAKRYSPRSKFSGFFGKQPVDVREFLLVGMHYCVPNSQVEKVIDLIPYRWLPNVEPVVAGVAEHEGKLLPVLDLAVWFGKSSSVMPDWKMILVKNGNFRALVLTKAVSKKMSLPTEMHRALPITLPHQYVYGCYPDEDTAIRIILNIEVMAVHFDKSAIKDFINITSRRGIEVSEEAQPEFPEPEAHEVLRTQEAGTIHEELEENRQEVDKPEKAEETPDEALLRVVPGDVTEEQKPDKELEPAPEEEVPEEMASVDKESGVLTADKQPQGATAEPDAAEPQAPDTEDISDEQDTDLDGHDINGAEPEGIEEQTGVSPPDESVPEEASQETAFEATQGDVAGDREPAEGLEQVPEETASPDQELDASIGEALIDNTPVPSEPEAHEMLSTQETGAIHEELEKSRQEVDEAEKAEETPDGALLRVAPGDVTEEQKPDEGLEPAPEATPQEAAFVGGSDDSMEKDEPAATGVTEQWEEIPASEESCILEDMGEGAQTAARSADEESDVASEGRKKRWLAYAAIAAVFIIVLYLSGVFVTEKPKQAIDSTVEESSSEMGVTQETSPVTPQPAQDQAIELTEPIMSAVLVPEIDSAVEESPHEMVTAQNTLPEILPPVPDQISGPVELQGFAFEVSKVHEVVKGDTLWDICEYYTGNPFNYHIVAVHNKIPNPDFILPGQKIVLYKIDKELDKKRSLP